MFSRFRSTKPERFERQREAWLKVLARGKRRFIFLRAFFWGGLMFVPTFASDLAFRDDANEWLFLPFSVLIWFGFG